MLKRLTLTVFVFGLVLTLGAGLAFAGYVDGITSRSAVSTHNQNAEPAVRELGSANPALQRAADDLTQMPLSAFNPSKQVVTSPDTNACYEQDYTDYAGTLWFYAWSRYAGDPRKLSMRFEAPAKHTAELNGAYVYLFVVEPDTTVANTTVPVQIQVWSDVGGLNDAVLYSEVYNVPADPVGGWYYFPFAVPPQITDGAWHISAAADSSGDFDDFIQLASDDGGDGGATGTGRGTYYSTSLPGWGLNTTIFGPAFDPNYLITSDACFWFSSCYTAFPDMGSGALYVLRMPRDYTADFGIPDAYLNGFAQRFVSEGPETLMTVDVYLNNRPGVKYYVGTNETNALIVEIWPDDGSGNLDSTGGPLASRTIPAGAANMYPVTNEDRTIATWEVHSLDFSADNLVLTGPWHVSARMSTDDPLGGQVYMGVFDFGVGGTWHTTTLGWALMGTDFTWLNLFWGNDASFYITPHLCKDEFAICKTQVLYLAGATHIFGLPLNIAGKVKGNPVNRLEKFRFQFWDDGAVPGSYGVDPVVWADNGGFPGAELWRGATLDASTSTPYPGWTEVVIPGGLQIVGDFFIGYEEASTDPNGAIAYMVELASPEINNGAKYYSTGSAIWKDLGDVVATDANALLEADFCSIPVEEIACAPGTEWNTVNGDYARTGHSNDAIGDAWCDLDLAWQYEHPSLGTIRSGPVISGDYVIQSFSSGTNAGYYIFDLVTGTFLDSVTTTDYPVLIGGQVRCTPTVETIDIGGTPTTVLFVAGGTATGMSAWDLGTVGGPIAKLWSIDFFTNFGGIPYNGHNDVGSVRYGNFIVLNDGAVDVVYFSDDNQRVFAANAADGTPYAPWGGNITLAGSPLRSGATDGTNLYFSLFTSGVEGDIVAVDAFTGAAVWNLAGGDGLQAATVWGGDYTANSETFAAGVSVDNGELYANSNASGNFPVQGIFYRLNAATGGLLSATGGLNQTTTHPLVDAANVIMFSRYTWGTGGNSPLGGSVVAYSRANGGISWISTPPGTGTFDHWILYEGVMSCEPSGAPDIAIGFSGGNSGDQGYLSFFNGDDGNEIFHRRVDHGSGQNVGGPGAIGVDSFGGTHVLFADAWGTLYDLQKSGVNRPRLEVLQWSQNQAVPFGSPADTLVTFPAMYTNTGCADLVVDLVASDASNGVTVGGSPSITPVRESFAAFSDGLANGMTSGSSAFRKFATRVEDGDVAGQFYEDIRAKSTREATNRAAMAVPAYLIENGTYAGDVFDPAGGGITTAPGDTAGITVHVVGPLINRGPQSFYVEFTVHNDPDYFLNDNSLRPQVFLTLVGGCLLDTTMLEFGPGAANYQWVFNTARSGDPDFPGDGTAVTNLSVDGFENGNFAGFYTYGVTDKRIAMDAENWFGQGDDNSWISIQADPNFVDDQCKPNLASGVSLGSFSTDGVTYTALTGDMISKSWIDSVQNFDDGFGGWDWSLFKLAPFDNDSTMGLYGNTRTFAVVDAPTGAELLNNLHVEIFEITERNGNSVPNWKFGSFIDNDIVVDETGASYDTTYFDQSVSSGWSTTDLGTNLQSGYIKLPFGCGETPMKNAFPMERAQTATCGNSACAWDSLYFYMSQPANTSYGHNSSTADDQDAFYTFVEHDFAPNETISFAVATYYYNGVTNTTVSDEFVAPAAHLVNKWVGYGRGDVDNDDAISLGDIIYLADYVNAGGPGPIPFMHLGDVDGASGIDMGDVQYLIDYYFNSGPCPAGAWTL